MKYMVISKSKTQHSILWTKNHNTSDEVHISGKYTERRIRTSSGNKMQNRTGSNNFRENEDLYLQIKIRLVSCYVYVLLNEVEAWTISEPMEKKIQAFVWI